MRVCLISSQIAAWGKIGGFGSNTRRLGGGLVRAGVEVHAVVPRRPGQGRIERLNGMIVHGQSLREVFFGQALYREIGADIYHTCEPTIGAYWAHAAMPDRVHLVTSMDPRGWSAWAVELRNATWSRRLKFPLQWLYESGPLVGSAVRRADGVYVEAEFLKPAARRLYRLDADPGLAPKPVEIPAGPFVKSAHPLCVWLGRFDPRKRPETFFELVRRMPDVRFVAIGQAHDRTYQSYLERRYFGLPNLEVVGFLDPFADGRLHEILSRAWILVHPAAREGLPTAFQEASAREVAILAFVDPMRYVSRFGRAVPEGAGVEGLEQALRSMIGSDEWRARGQAGRRYNREHHAVEVSVRTHLDIYQRHLEQRGACQALAALPATPG